MGADAVQQVAEVSRTADFDAFYRRERAVLYRALTLTVGDADLAADAVDEAMVRAYQHWWRVSGYDNPAGWVYRVGLNWAISRTRLRRRTVPVAAVTEHPATGAAAADPAVTAAVAALPAKLRAVVVLRFHLDWTVEQIAIALRVPPGTVKSRLHRGLASLRNELGENRRES